jgi:agmatinase
MRDSYLENKYSHACVMARVKEINNSIVAVGIRSLDSSELDEINESKTFFAKDIYNTENWIGEAINELNKNVYITIDLDVFDPSIMPSTGTPEPGGLTWYPVLKFLKEVFENRNVIGFDVVELCPNETKFPDFLAAKLIYKLIGYKFSAL